MKKKIFYLFFVLSLIKLYDIADRSLNFSSNILLASFKHNTGENISLGAVAKDVIPIRNFFLKKNISEYKLSDEILKNHEVFYQRVVELNYPAKIKLNSAIVVSHKDEIVKQNCHLLHFTDSFNIYECK
jgi:hypothetical protein